MTGEERLEAELAALLPNDPAPLRRAFLTRAIDRGVLHCGLIKPMMAGRTGALARLAELQSCQKAASKTAKAAKAACDDPLAREMLVIECFMRRRRSNPDQAPAVADEQLANATRELKAVFAAAEIAMRLPDIAAGALARQTENDPHANRRPNRGDGKEAVDAAGWSLTADLARDYFDIFGRPPSAAREGTFAKVLHAVFAAFGINVIMGEKRVAEILHRPIMIQVLCEPPYFWDHYWGA